MARRGARARQRTRAIRFDFSKGLLDGALAADRVFV
jgi:hypothetical protein